METTVHDQVRVLRLVRAQPDRHGDRVPVAPPLGAVLADGAQHPVAQRERDAGTFRQAQALVVPDGAELLGLPQQLRLDPVRPAVAQVHRRPVRDVELAGGQPAGHHRGPLGLHP